MDQDPIRELSREHRFHMGCMAMFLSPALVVFATLFFALPPPELRPMRDWPSGPLLLSHVVTFGGALLALLNLGTTTSACKRFICCAAVAMAASVGLSSTAAAEQCAVQLASFDCVAGMFPLAALLAVSAVAVAIVSADLRAVIAAAAGGADEHEPLLGPGVAQPL